MPKQLSFSEESSVDTLVKERYKWYTNKEQGEKHCAIALVLDKRILKLIFDKI